MRKIIIKIKNPYMKLLSQLIPRSNINVAKDDDLQEFRPLLN